MRHYRVYRGATKGLQGASINDCLIQPSRFQWLQGRQGATRVLQGGDNEALQGLQGCYKGAAGGYN